MAQKTISASGSTWTGTASADQAYISYADRVRLNTGGGNDSIFNYYGWYETIDAGDGNDTVKSYRGKDSSIVGGAGNDLISLSGDSAGQTISGGKGNDSIYGDAAAQLFQYANGDGNDVIYNWSANDTISITGASGYSRSTVGSDVVLGVGNGKITLKGAKGKTVNVKFASGVIFNNILSNHVVNGTANVDKIENTGNHVTINAYGSNDSVLNTFSNNIGGDYVSINGGAGNDTIRNNQGFYDTISGGDGADYIYSYRGKNSSISGGAGSDLISLGGDLGSVTINGGKDNDTIYCAGGKNIIQYVSGDGADVVYNLSANDTISITGGSYTRSTVGSDVVLKVGSGYVTLKGAKNSNVNVKGTQTTSTTPTPSTSKVSIPSGAFTYGGHSYYIYWGDSISWSTAKSYCESRGGHLAVINSAGENTALFNYMKRAGYDSAYFGFSDASKEGTWSWVNGERVSYTNWASGEPNGGTYENYGMFYYRYPDGKWNDGNFAKGSTFYSDGKKIVDTNAFICEWDTVTSSNVQQNVGINVNNTISNKIINGTSYADTIKNIGNRVTINSAAGNDSILNTFSNGAGGDYVSINGGAGNDTIRNDQGFYDTINGGDGADYIYSYKGKNSSINGGTGADLISLSGDAVNVTVNGGTGNDSIYGDKAAQLFQYASGDGNDLIYNLGATDTISITGGSYTRSTVGSDVVIKIGSNSVTLKGAKNSTVKIIGQESVKPAPQTQPTVPPQSSGNVIYGTNGHDSIKNTVAGKVIYAYDGNDTVRNSANNVYISGGAGNDSIESYSYAANVTVNGDDGNDNIKVSGANAKIYGGNGNDSVYIVKGNNDYIEGGAGDDTLDVWSGNNLSLKGGTGNDVIDLASGSSCVIAYNSGDGSDTIWRFDGNDTLKVYGSYTRSTVGNDVVVKVGYGSITLKNAKNSTLNISNLSSSADLVSSADLASDDWISADDNNFVTNDTRLDSIVETTATDYSVGNLYSATTSLTPRNIFVAFTGKK